MTGLDYKKKLLLSVSFMTLGLCVPQSAQAQNCTGAQSRTATCQDYQGNNVDDVYCTSNGLTKPATSQDCTYACPPPPYYGGGGGDGGDGGSGGWTSFSYTDNGDGTHSRTQTEYNSDGSVNSASTIGNSGPNSNFADSSGWSSGGDGDGDGDGGGDGSVLCTYFHGKGEMPERDYYAGFIHAFKHLNKFTWRGYHTWAVPYVEYMRAHPNSLAERFIKPLLFLRAEEISYQMGLRDRPNYKGKLVRLAFESFSMAIGLFAKDPDYTKLYTREQMAEFPKKFRAYKERQVQKVMRRDPTALLT